MGKNKRWLAADFETIKNPIRVVSWMLYNKKENHKTIGIDIDSFMDELLKLDEDYIVYFNNGANFDFHFFPSYFKKHKWDQWKDKEECKSLGIKYEPLLKEKQFKFLAGQGKKIYSFQIALPNFSIIRGKKKHKTIIFKDAYLLWQTSIKNMGQLLLSKKVISEENLKGEIDYEKLHIFNNVDELLKDKEQLQYLENDVIILYEFLQYIHKNILAMNKWKYSIAGTSYAFWYEMFGNKLLETSKDVKVFNSKNGYNSYYYKKTKRNPNFIRNELIKEIFPTEWLDENDNFNIFYKWYSGGWTGYNPDWRGLILKNVSSWDRNSSYPFELANSIFPSGIPIKGNWKDANVKLYSVTILDVINENGLPFIARAGFEYREYLKKPPAAVYYLTDQELIRFKKYYKGLYKVRCEYSFKGVKGSFVFGDYVNHWNKLKEWASENKDDILRQIAKNFNNNLYGKMGTKKYRTTLKLNEEYEWESEDKEIKSNYYLPIAFVTTANARMSLVDIVDENFKNFIYSDTDSLYLITNNFKYNIPVDDKKLGHWKKEHTWNSFVVKDKKSYMGYCSKKGLIVKSSGYRFDMEITFEEFLINPNNITIKSTRGKKSAQGVVVDAYDKMLKPIWEMTKHKEQWFKNKDDYLNNYLVQLKTCNQ